MAENPVAVKITLPYHLSLERIVQTQDRHLVAMAEHVVRSIPSDDWFGKVSLTNTLIEIADKEEGTATKREKILKFIKALNEEWELKRGRRS